MNLFSFSIFLIQSETYVKEFVDLAMKTPIIVSLAGGNNTKYKFKKKKFTSFFMR